MKWAEFVAEYADATGQTLHDSREQLEQMRSMLLVFVRTHERLEWPKLGVWTIRRHKRRRILNPSTRAPMMLPGLVTLGFKAAKWVKVGLGDRRVANGAVPPRDKRRPRNGEVAPRVTKRDFDQLKRVRRRMRKTDREVDELRKELGL